MSLEHAGAKNQPEPILVYYTNGLDGPKFSISKPTLNIPSTVYNLEYLDEGGANIIFKVLATSDTLHSSASEKHAGIQNKLLRLRKDLAHTAATQDQYRAFNHSFAPLFPKDSLVDLDPIQLSPDLPEVINDTLSQLPNRTLRRRNDLLPLEETLGLLVTDMSPTETDTLLQLKPKWLAQSPSAPQNARRCRTCALRAQRASKQGLTATDAQGCCPLRLVTEDVQIRSKAVESLTGDKPMQDFLIHDAHALLHTLRSHQQRFDEHGALTTVETNHEVVADLCKAMTLRDCTLFIRRSGHGDRAEAKLADLDMKHPQKLKKWQEVERGLIDGGWYDNTEITEHWQRESLCLLAEQ